MKKKIKDWLRERRYKRLNRLWGQNSDMLVEVTKRFGEEALEPFRAKFRGDCGNLDNIHFLKTQAKELKKKLEEKLKEK